MKEELSKRIYDILKFVEANQNKIEEKDFPDIMALMPALAILGTAITTDNFLGIITTFDQHYKLCLEIANLSDKQDPLDDFFTEKFSMN